MWELNVPYKRGFNVIFKLKKKGTFRFYDTTNREKAKLFQILCSLAGGLPNSIIVTAKHYPVKTCPLSNKSINFGPMKILSTLI